MRRVTRSPAGPRRRRPSQVPLQPRPAAHDPLIRARPFILDALGEISRRTLFEMIRRGDFPPPDVPAGRLGEPDRWRQSTALRGIAEFGKRRSQDPDPESKPSSRRPGRPRKQSLEHPGAP